jgi:hypothetical protein
MSSQPDRGKDITDPARGHPEIRGGETPDDWTGPLPAADIPPGKAEPEVLDDSGSSARITHPGKSE